ncbi:hypothetical protein [Hoeflea olei]|uniref:Uncharacterized protein n=1 Tax=Hoeflea olei TaxID=1480615 RepID=A0A1C1YXE8_9HYPH|nr:hypothetical protein [Hoeflea olei]OCW58109.1 hypothetical protein AWJ14_15785 [Hoeflea olei]
MTLYHIHLVMARNKEFPEGNVHRGYDIHAPLDADGHLDEAAWEKAPAACTVVRFWDGARSELGYLVHDAKAGWVFDYDPADEDDDETGYRLSSHVFKTGEYISVRDHDAGELHTFVISSVTPAG